MREIADAWNRSDLAEVRRILKRQIPVDDEPDLRGIEWHHWNARSAAELWSADAHNGRIVATQVDLEGNVISVGADGTIRTWDPIEGKLLIDRKTSLRVKSAAIHRRRPLVVLGASDGTLEVQHLQDGSTRRLRLPIQQSVNALCFGANTSTVVIGGSAGDIYTLGEQMQLRRLATVQGLIRDIAISERSGITIVGDNDGAITALDLATGNVVWERKVHEAPLMKLELSPKNDGIASVGLDGALHVNNFDGAPMYAQQFGEPLTAVNWSVDGRLILANRLGAARILDASTGTTLVAELCHADMVSALAANERRFVAASDAGSLKVFDMDRRPPLSKKLWEHERCALSPSGEFAAYTTRAESGAPVVELSMSLRKIDPAVLC